MKVAAAGKHHIARPDRADEIGAAAIVRPVMGRDDHIRFDGNDFRVPHHVGFRKCAELLRTKNVAADGVAGEQHGLAVIAEAHDDADAVVFLAAAQIGDPRAFRRGESVDKGRIRVAKLIRCAEREFRRRQIQIHAAVRFHFLGNGGHRSLPGLGCALVTGAQHTPYFICVADFIHGGDVVRIGVAQHHQIHGAPNGDDVLDGLEARRAPIIRRACIINQIVRFVAVIDLDDAAQTRTNVCNSDKNGIRLGRQRLHSPCEEKHNERDE